MTYTNETKTLKTIIKTLETHNNTLTLYGTINYTRTQYLPQLSKKITQKETNPTTFYNYTTLESMILDLLKIIESNTIKKIENNTYNKEKTQQTTQYTKQLLTTLQKILTKTQTPEQTTQEINKKQNKYYQLIYDEITDIRIKE